MKRLSIVIPCYNEVHTIENIVARIAAVPLGNWEREIIIVDDASSDGTRELLEKMQPPVRVIFRAHNGGKGSAVRDGLVHATGTHILLQDADLEYDPEEIPLLLEQIDAGEDVVYGSRNLRPREREGAWIPRLGVWFLTVLINVLYGLKLTDAWTCYKLFPVEAKGDFSAGRFDSELLFTAALARRGYRFAEVAISYHPRDAAAGKKIRYRDGLHAIAAICLDWLRHGHHARIMRFLVSGAAGLVTNLAILHVLVHTGMYYLLASVCAVSLSAIVGFLLQKFWTFKAHSTKRMHRQFGLYVTLALVNIVFNTALVYLFVEGFGVHYLFAQALAAAIVAVWSFVVYSRFIFITA